MMRNDLTRTLGKLRWTAAVGFGFCAAFAFLIYVANSIVVGDLTGLPGHGNQVDIARHRAGFGLLAFAFFQIGTLAAVFSLIDREDGHAATRIAISVLGSLGLTIVCGVLIYLAFELLR